MILPYATTSSKTKKSSADLIALLKNDKGVLFNIVSEADAISYIKNVNNFLRTAAYRKNYRTNSSGKYIGLEFAYLQELSIIDMYLRNLITQMCIDVEHDLKVSLLSDLETNPNEDGYKIVIDFLNDPSNTYIHKDIIQNRKSTFVGNLINKYFTFSQTNSISDCNCPMWVLVEILSFGSIIKFYEFYYKRKKLPRSPIQCTLLHLIRSLRNGCAHNNCLICDLSPEPGAQSPTILNRTYSNLKGIKNSALNKKLKCRFIMEFCALLFVYRQIKSKNVMQYRLDELKNLFFKRMCRNRQYFRKNDVLTSTYFFLAKIIRNQNKT